MSRAEYAAEIHRRAQGPKQIRRVQVRGIDSTWTSDETGPIADPTKANRGFKYLLFAMDVFSRYAWVTPLKEITAASTWAAYSAIMRDSGRSAPILWVDQGTAYFGKPFLEPAKRAGIHLYSFYSEHKAAYAERLIQTIMGRLWKRMTEKDSKKLGRFAV